MAKGEAKTPAALGFLTVLDHPQHGLMGGYLVLNAAGRPLEFHCTAPVKPNRAQQILYGPTLEPFLYGEQIGQALIGEIAIGPAGDLHRRAAGDGGAAADFGPGGAGAGEWTE